MWPFQQRYSEHINILASLLDTVLLESVEKLQVTQRMSFVLELRKNTNVDTLALDSLDLQGVMPRGVSWRDKRLPSFLFQVNFNDEPWAISAHWNDAPKSPSFMGIMVGANPVGSERSISKWVSVEDWMQVKATSFAKVLGEVLASKHEYRLFKP
ncbi:MAG TPA: hypothetical protein VJL61_01970 [Rhodanobacteraceae bacterium]|nr:hypothetical protein [Rhodanobacteraceae bacterium]